MYALAGLDRESFAGDMQMLLTPTLQVHFHPRPRGIEKRTVDKCVGIDIAIKLAVDPVQQIAVEPRGEPGGVVVGGIEDGWVLDQVNAQDKAVARPQQAACLAQKRHCFIRRHIADGGPWKKRYSFPRCLGQQAGVKRRGEIGAQPTDGQVRPSGGQGVDGLTQRGLGNVDGDSRRWRRQRPQQPVQLGWRTAAEFDHRGGGANMGGQGRADNSANSVRWT